LGGPPHPILPLGPITLRMVEIILEFDPEVENRIVILDGSDQHYTGSVTIRPRERFFETHLLPRHLSYRVAEKSLDKYDIIDIFDKSEYPHSHRLHL
jgi:hypothetical protein